MSSLLCVSSILFNIDGLTGLASRHNNSNPIRTWSTVGRLYSTKPDPTANFNADILRIASRTADKKSNFDPVDASEHSLRMLKQMIKMYEQSEHKTAKPNTESFRIVLRGFSNLGRSVTKKNNYVKSIVDDDQRYLGGNIVDKMEDILIMLDNFAESTSSDDLQLNTDVLNLLLKVYARSSIQQLDTKCPGKIDLCDEDEMLPWRIEECQRGTCGERAEKVIRYMRKYSSINPAIVPNSLSYAYVIEALSKEQPSMKKRSIARKQPLDDFAKRASKWISEIEREYESVCIHDKSVEGKERRIIRRHLLWAYSDALDAWSRSGSQISAAICDEYISTIEQISAEDVRDVNTFMNCNVTVEDPSPNASQAKPAFTQQNLLLFDGKDTYLDPYSALYPSDQSYTSAILALSRSSDPSSADRAHSILKQMLQLYDSGKWVKNRPSTFAFNCVINAFASSQSSGAAGKAESVLDLLESLYFDKNKPEYSHLRPDIFSYNSAVIAWSRCREEAAVYKAEKIVRRMEKHANSVGHKFLDVYPDKYTYNSLIYGWTNSNLGVASAVQAEDILRTMIMKYGEGNKSFAPDQKIFCSVINAWARCGDDRDGVKNAMKLLDLMNELYNEGMYWLKPDCITFTSVMDAVVRSGDPNSYEIVSTILKEMIEGFQLGETNMKPTVKTFSSVLQSLVKSQVSDKHVKAMTVLKTMNELKVEPNAFTYNYVIESASSVSDDQNPIEAFKVALSAFTSLRNSKSAKCDSFTYAFFFKSCSILLPSSMRVKVVQETFKACISEGQLNNQVLYWVKQSLTADEFRAMLQVKTLKDVDVSDLAPEWSQYSSRGRVE